GEPRGHPPSHAAQSALSRLLSVDPRPRVLPGGASPGGDGRIQEPRRAKPEFRPGPRLPRRAVQRNGPAGRGPRGMADGVAAQSWSLAGRPPTAPSVPPAGRPRAVSQRGAPGRRRVSLTGDTVAPTRLASLRGSTDRERRR